MGTGTNPPTVTNVNPNNGPSAGGTAVTITGTNFTSASLAVQFGGVSATIFAYISATSVTATSPADPSGGLVDVIVTNSFGSSTANPPYDQFLFGEYGAAILLPTSALISRGNEKFGGRTTLSGSSVLGATGIVLSIYGTTVLQTSGLQFFWAMQETSGTTAFDSKDSNTGTYNSCTLAQPGPVGGHSVLFSGSSYVSTINTVNYTALSFELWYYTSGIGGPYLLIGFYQSGEYSAQLLLTNSAPMFSVYDGTTKSVTGNIVPNNTWTHLVGTVSNSGNAYLYQDGVSVGTPVAVGTLQMGYTGPNICIGGGNPFKSDFPGNLSNVAVYNTALSQAQALAHYEASFTQGSANLAAGIALSATGSMTAILYGQAILFAQTLFGGHGTVTHNANAILTTVSLIQATGIRTRNGQATLAAGFGITANGTKAASGKATILSVITLTTRGNEKFAGKTTFLSAMTLIANGTKAASGKATFLSAITLTARGNETFTGKTTFLSVTTLTAKSNKTASAKATLLSTITLIASANEKFSGKATCLSVTTMTASGTKTTSGKVTLLSATTLIARGIKRVAGVVTLSTASVLLTKGNEKFAANARLQTSSTFTMVSAGNAVLSSVSSLTAKGNVVFVGRIVLTTASTFSGRLIANYHASVLLSSITSIQVTASMSYMGTLSWNSIAFIGVNSSVLLPASALLIVYSSVTSEGISFVNGKAVLTAVSSINTIANLSHYAAALLNAISYVSSYANVGYNVSAGTLTSSAITSTGTSLVNGEGSLVLSSTINAATNLQQLYSYGMYWQLNESAIATFNFIWDVGAQRQYWYRVVGQPRNDTCPPLGGDGCCKQLLMTVQAANVGEVCSKIQSQFGIWPIQSIQRFSKPAETAAIAADAANGITYDCNVLQDVPYCNVPLCAPFCVDYTVQENWGVIATATLPTIQLVQSLSLPKFTPQISGSVAFGRSAKNRLIIKAKSQGKIKFGGTATVQSSSHHYKSIGSYKISGKARIIASHWMYHSSCSKSVTVTKFDVEQVGLGTPWQIGSVYTNDLANGPSQTLMFSNLDVPPGKLVGMIISFRRCANGFVKDTIVTMSKDHVLRTMPGQYNWPLAIPAAANYGNSTDVLGFMPDEPFAIGVSIQAVTSRNGLVTQLFPPTIQLIYDTGGRVRFGGSSPIHTSFWNYKTSGGINLSGKAISSVRIKKKVAVPHYPLVFEPIIQAQGISKGKSVKELVVKALSTGDSSTVITPMPQKTPITLAPPTNTVSTCLCTSMPLSLTFSHNLASANKLEQFFQRNGITLSNYVTMDYNTANTSWQQNLHFQGASSAALNAESWVIVFELQCTNILGGTQIGTDVWRFAIKILQRNLLTNEASRTRLMVAFLPDVLCTTGKDFRFILTIDTQIKLATIDPSSTIYETTFYDSIGLFKTANWITSPDLLINMTQIVTPVPRYPLYIGSNS